MDEVTRTRHLQMRLLEFMEALARVADKVDMTLFGDQTREVPSLATKLELFIQLCAK